MRNRIRALILCFSFCLLMVFSGCQNVKIIKETTAETAFKPVEFEKVGNHTYYRSDIFKTDTMEAYKKENILPLIEEADKSLDADVLLTNFNISIVSGNMRLYGFLMSDGVIYQEINLYADKDNNSVYAWSEEYKGVTLPQKGTLMDAKDYYDDVFDLAKKHKREMFIQGAEQPISGEYYIKGNLDGTVYYDFIINYNSAVWIDAYTGEIIHTYFFNGLYTD